MAVTWWIVDSVYSGCNWDAKGLMLIISLNVELHPLYITLSFQQLYIIQEA